MIKAVSSLFGKQSKNDDQKKVSQRIHSLRHDMERERVLVSTRNDIEVPNRGNALAFTLDNVLTQDECVRLIACAEGTGFDVALVNVGMGRQEKMTDFRNNDRVIIDSPEIAEVVWQRIKHAVPATWESRGVQWFAVGLNERLRILRYDVGQMFKTHQDGTFVRGREAGERDGECSFVTVQVYLNEGFQGGCTTFEDRTGTIVRDVVPATGRTLVFQHNLLHRGSVLESGRKYCVRTDVMYTRLGPGREYSVNPIQLPSTGVALDVDFTRM